ncbi:MAG: hypothetical protein P8Y25_14770, partial [Chromatiaceae bacterium]
MGILPACNVRQDLSARVNCPPERSQAIAEVAHGKAAPRIGQLLAETSAIACERSGGPVTRAEGCCLTVHAGRIPTGQ